MRQLTAEERSLVHTLTTERKKMKADDPIAVGADIDATWFAGMLAEQAAQHDRETKWLWRAIYALLFIAFASLSQLFLVPLL